MTVSIIARVFSFLVPLRSPSSAVPGFEAIFVITALLVVYLFVLRRKRK